MQKLIAFVGGFMLCAIAAHADLIPAVIRYSDAAPVVVTWQALQCGENGSCIGFARMLYGTTYWAERIKLDAATAATMVAGACSLDSTQRPINASAPWPACGGGQ